MVVCIDTTVKRRPLLRSIAQCVLRCCPNLWKFLRTIITRRREILVTKIFPLPCMVHSLLLGDSYGGEENRSLLSPPNGASDDNAVRLDTLLKDFKAIQENHLILRWDTLPTTVDTESLSTRKNRNMNKLGLLQKTVMHSFYFSILFQCSSNSRVLCFYPTHLFTPPPPPVSIQIHLLIHWITGAKLPKASAGWLKRCAVPQP